MMVVMVIMVVMMVMVMIWCVLLDMTGVHIGHRTRLLDLVRTDHFESSASGPVQQ